LKTGEARRRSGGNSEMKKLLLHFLVASGTVRPLKSNPAYEV
jgi:hypothetical protein